MAFKMLDFEEKERLLNAAGPTLLKQLDTRAMFMAYLVQAQVISPQDAEDIKAHTIPGERNDKLLTYLYSASVLQFVRFCVVLHDKANRGDIVQDVLKLDIKQLRSQELNMSKPGEAAIQLEERPPQDASTSTTTHEHSETTHYCSFILADKFDIGNSDVQSPEYIQFVTDKEDRIEAVLQEHTRKTAEVRVMAVSERKQMLFVSIKCLCGLSDVQIEQALMSTNSKLPEKPLSIVDRTLHFRDGIAASLACDVVKKSHVHDKFGHKVDFDTQYVRLKMLAKDEMSTVERDELEQPHKYQARLQCSHSAHITDEEIMAPGDDRKFVVIRGRAGIGKTTIVHCFMWKWAHGNLARQFTAIFLLNLRTLMAITTQLTLPNLLTRFPVFTVGQHGTTLDATWLKENAQSIAFILDGLDEIANFRSLWNKPYTTSRMDKEASALHWGMAILKRVQLGTSTVLVTSRPFAALSCIKPTLLVEVMGLTRERVMEFVDRNVIPEQVPTVKQTLMNSPILLSVSAITFYCSALCRVLQNDIGATKTLTTYTQITAFIIQNFMKHSVKKATRSEVLKGASSHISSLCQMAYEGLVKRRNGGVAQLIFDKTDYKRHNLQEEEVQIAGEMGLFLQTEIPEPKEPDNKQVLGEFVHLSVQEFLAMASVPKQKKEDVEETVKMLSTSGQFNMSLLFLYGFVFNKSNETIKMVSQALGADGENTDGLATLLKQNIQNVSDDLQVLQMVHESQSPEIAREVGQRRFREVVRFANTKLTVVDILAVTFLLKHNPSTTRIDLHRTDLDAICVKELARFLQDNNTVERLSLFEKDLDDESTRYLADMLKVNRTLTELITGVPMTDTGLAALAAALEVNTSVTNLMLHNVTDTGAAALAAALKVNTTITSLTIGSPRMTDTGVGHLAAALRSNTTLERLELMDAPVHEEGAAALVEALEVNTKVHIEYRIYSSEEVKRQLHHSRITVL